MELITQESQRIDEQLTWCTLSGDQAGIVMDLADEKEISEVDGLGEAGLFDGFFKFPGETGLMKSFMQLDLGKARLASEMKLGAVIVICPMRVVAGLAFFRHIDPMILG